MDFFGSAAAAETATAAALVAGGASGLAGFADDVSGTLPIVEGGVAAAATMMATDLGGTAIAPTVAGGAAACTAVIELATVCLTGGGDDLSAEDNM